MNRLILLVESRIRGDVYVRFGGELPKTHRSNTAGRWMLSLPLKSVNNLVKDARKVSEIILMVGDVSEIYVTNFRKMLGDENFSAGTGRHRLRVHPAAGREQRRAAGPETGHQCQHPLDDGQGPDGCGGRLSCQHAPLPQPGELLYEPEHCREYPPCPEEERSGPRTGALRK